MSLNITTNEIDGISVLALNGRIVLGEESNWFRERVKGVLSDGKKKIILNMANVEYVDSAGLGILVAAHVSAKKQGAALHLCNLGQEVPRCDAIDEVADRFQRLRYPSRRD